MGNVVNPIINLPFRGWFIPSIYGDGGAGLLLGLPHDQVCISIDHQDNI
jgi:hypothetical protein